MSLVVVVFRFVGLVADVACVFVFCFVCVFFDLIVLYWFVTTLFCDLVDLYCMLICLLVLVLAWALDCLVCVVCMFWLYIDLLVWLVSCFIVYCGCLTICVLIKGCLILLRNVCFDFICLGYLFGLFVLLRFCAWVSLLDFDRLFG